MKDLLKQVIDSDLLNNLILLDAAGIVMSIKTSSDPVPICLTIRVIQSDLVIDHSGLPPIQSYKHNTGDFSTYAYRFVSCKYI